jgi:hypothetical protein
VSAAPPGAGTRAKAAKTCSLRTAMIDVPLGRLPFLRRHHRRGKPWVNAGWIMAG